MGALDNIYPHANTIVCIEEGKLLKRFQYDLLYNAKGLQAALDELNNINYFHTYKNAEPGTYGLTIDALMADTFALMGEIAPTGLIPRMFSLYYDIHNMKLAAKERFMGKRLDRLALEYGGYSMPTIRSAAVKQSDDILENETLTAGFFEALHSGDIYDIDFVLDKTYFKTLRRYAEALKSPEILEFVIERIDLFDVSVFFQSMAAGNPPGYFERAFSDEGSFSLPEWQQYTGGERPETIEKFSLWQKYSPLWENIGDRARIFWEFDVLADNYLIEKTKICKLMAFGVEPICAYFFNKFMEIKNIRILLAGKERHYNTEAIKKRMRIAYEL